MCPGLYFDNSDTGNDMSEVKHEHYVVVDLEATCCDIKSVKAEEMEIIEIGAVMVEGDSLAAVDEYQTFIRPVRHPNLTSFCTALTTITQADVNNAPGFKDALSNFRQWLAQYENCVFCSWGKFDKKQFEQDCRFHKVAYPFASTHINIKQQFTESQGLAKKYGMKGALRLVGLELEGTHHRGIDDARNMVPLMPYALGRDTLPLIRPGVSQVDH